MPTIDHEALLLLFREQPGLVATVLRRLLGVALAPDVVARVVDGAWSEVQRSERRADLVALLGEGPTRLCVIVEVQLAHDPEKRYRWPLYVAALEDRYRCPTYLLVVTPNAALARRTARPRLFGGPHGVFVPLVLGPSAIPCVTAEADARAEPELAVLSAMAHPNRADVALAAIVASAQLDADRAVLYNDLVLRTLGSAARRKLEQLMQSKAYEFKSDFARHYIALGKAEGKAGALVAFLRARGLMVTPSDEARIAASALPLVESWILRAAAVSSVDELWR